ncbi:MAG TPA: ABC transporter permease subunit [Gammaproteobacteria bacterium]|nr:ABC transporter permease subunit [Gammaproteobacteria bacterium]
MSRLRRSTDTSGSRQRRDRTARVLARGGAWLLLLLLALPLLDLLRRASGGLEWALFLRPDSIEAGAAGIRGALQASLLALVPVILVATPLGLAVAVYLEEIAARRGVAALVDGSVRHLATLPPVVFGLLGFGGLVVVLGLPVGTPLLAGAVLGLAMLPRVVLAGQFALRQVPAFVRETGYAMGASPLQVVTSHVLPRAAPAMVGASFSMLARALGEAAPLLLVGFAAFAVGRPQAMTEPGIPLPVVVYQWGGLPDPLFAARAAAAGLVLVVAVMLLGVAGEWLARRGRAT